LDTKHREGNEREEVVKRGEGVRGRSKMGGRLRSEWGAAEEKVN
jgi:hypothetical protein